MSIGLNIQGLPDTKQMFANNNSGTSEIAGMLITDENVSFLGLDELLDIDQFYSLMDEERLTPLHYIKSFEPKDRETEYVESLQGYSYNTAPSVLKHRVKYDWSADFYDLVKYLSGNNNKRIIYYDKGGNLHLISKDGFYKGYKNSQFTLENLALPVSGEPRLSVLDIELNELEEDEKTEIVDVGWSPEEIDRLFVSISIESVTPDNINFTVKHLNRDIRTISNSEVTLTDEINGNIMFTLFNYNGGVYQLAGFDKALNNGLLKIVTTLYIGCSKYRVTAEVEIFNNAIFGSGDNEIWGDGNNAVFTN